MKQLSLWAKCHPLTARFIIIISHVLLAGLAFYLANSMIRIGIHFSPLWLFISITAFFVTGMFYPRRSDGKKTTWRLRKTFDLAVAVTGFFIFFFTAAWLNQPVASPSAAHAAMSIKDPPTYKNPASEKLLKAFKSGEKTTFSKKEKKILRQEFGFQLKSFLAAKITGNKARANETLLIILSIIAAVGLFLLVVTFACSLSCNGSDAAAVIVALLGTAAIVWLLIKVIKAIKRKSTPKSG